MTRAEAEAKATEILAVSFFLADFTAMWLASIPDQELREELLASHIRIIRKLVPRHVLLRIGVP